MKLSRFEWTELHLRTARIAGWMNWTNCDFGVCLKYVYCYFSNQVQQVPRHIFDIYSYSDQVYNSQVEIGYIENYWCSMLAFNMDTWKLSIYSIISLLHSVNTRFLSLFLWRFPSYTYGNLDNNTTNSLRIQL
jgi:hypothetical protein